MAASLQGWQLPQHSISTFPSCTFWISQGGFSLSLISSYRSHLRLILLWNHAMEMVQSHLFLKCPHTIPPGQVTQTVPFLGILSGFFQVLLILNTFNSKVHRWVSGTSVWESQSCCWGLIQQAQPWTNSECERKQNPSSADVNNCRCLPWKREGYRLLTPSLPVFCPRRTSGICCKMRTKQRDLA